MKRLYFLLTLFSSVFLLTACPWPTPVPKATVKLDHAETGFGRVNSRDLQLGYYFIWDPSNKKSSQIIEKGILDEAHYKYPVSRTQPVGEKKERGVSGLDIEVTGIEGSGIAELKTTVGNELEIKTTNYRKATYNGGGMGEGNILNHKSTYPFRKALSEGYVDRYFIVVTEIISSDSAQMVYGGIKSDESAELSDRKSFSTKLTLAGNEVIAVNVVGGSSIDVKKGNPFIRFSFYQLKRDGEGATNFTFVPANLSELEKQNFIRELRDN